MLTKGMKKFVMSEDKRGYNKSQYNKRIREYAVKTIEDLSLIAQNMPEKMQGEIFDIKVLKPLFEVLLNINGEISDKDHEARRKRLLSLIRELLFTLEKNEMDRKLAPQIWNVLRHSPRSRLKTLNVIEAIFIASLNP